MEWKSRMRIRFIGAVYGLVNLIVYSAWFVAGTAAFLISATTSGYVISHISPYPAFAYAAGMAFDLTKVTGIFVETFGRGSLREQSRISSAKLIWIGRTLRISLMLLAFIMSAIAISGNLLNKNEGQIIEGKKIELKAQYDRLIVTENNIYNEKYREIQNGLNKERRTGIGPRYKQLEQERDRLSKYHLSIVKGYETEMGKKLEQMETKRLENDYRTNDQLINNFLLTVNKNAGTRISYEWLIILLVCICSGTIELTIFYTFSVMGNQLQEGMSKYHLYKTELEAYKMRAAINGMEVEEKAEQLVNEAVLETMKNAKDEGLLMDKLTNRKIRISKDMGKLREKLTEGLKDNILKDLDKILSNDYPGNPSNQDA